MLIIYITGMLIISVYMHWKLKDYVPIHKNGMVNLIFVICAILWPVVLFDIIRIRLQEDKR